MLADERVDVVYVATPIALHAAQVRQALEAGKHAWCEKPLAAPAEQAASLAALSRAKGRTLAEGFMYLYHPQFRLLRQIVDSGRLGVVQSATCRFGIPPLADPRFRSDPTLGGGAFLDVGSYPVSAVVGLFPDSDPRVSFSEILRADGSPVDTEGRAVLRYDSGAAATLEWRFNSAYRNEIEIWGAAGSVHTERVFSKPADHVPRFRFLDQQGMESHESADAADHFVLMFAAFRSLVDDAVAADTERSIVVRRARLLDTIRRTANEVT